MSGVRKNLSTEKSRKFWEGVEQDAREVEDWPAWKKVGVSIELPEETGPRPTAEAAAVPSGRAGQ